MIKDFLLAHRWLLMFLILCIISLVFSYAFVSQDPTPNQLCSAKFGNNYHMHDNGLAGSFCTDGVNMRYL